MMIWNERVPEWEEQDERMNYKMLPVDCLCFMRLFRSKKGYKGIDADFTSQRGPLKIGNKPYF